MAKVGVPTVRGVGGALKDYAYGAGGGLLFALSSQLFGSGLLGGALSAGIAGSVIKGTQGETIATMLGLQGIISQLGSGSTASANTQREVM